MVACSRVTGPTKGEPSSGSAWPPSGITNRSMGVPSMVNTKPSIDTLVVWSDAMGERMIFMSQYQRPIINTIKAVLVELDRTILTSNVVVVSESVLILVAVSGTEVLRHATLV